MAQIYKSPLELASALTPKDDHHIQFDVPTGKEGGVAKDLRDRGIEVVGINIPSNTLKFKYGDNFYVTGENDNYGWDIEKLYDQEGYPSERVLSDLNFNHGSGYDKLLAYLKGGK